jgi:hypothetical protein
MSSKSEVAQFRQRQALKGEAARLVLNGLAVTGSHESIIARMKQGREKASLCLMAGWNLRAVATEEKTMPKRDDEAINDVLGEIERNNGLKSVIKKAIQHRQAVNIENLVEKAYQEASRNKGDDQEIATTLYQASLKAYQDGNEQLSGALLERSLILALPYILQDDQSEEAQ